MNSFLLTVQTSPVFCWQRPYLKSKEYADRVYHFESPLQYNFTSNRNTEIIIITDLRETSPYMSDEKLSKLLASMSTLSPINRIQYQVMMFSDMDESIGSQIGNEIEKIRHSFDRTGSYQIWDGESSFELLEQIFQIAELLRQSSRYVLLGAIYKKIIFLLMHFISNSIHLDDDVENFMDRITDDLMKWEWSEMTDDELSKLSAVFSDAEFFSLLDDFNYGDRVRMVLKIL